MTRAHTRMHAHVTQRNSLQCVRSDMVTNNSCPMPP